MPEIKNAFTQGKMNKDLDERLVENGQYRDAMNIQVSTSEGSDVGAVQNILGNLNLFETNELALNAKCVGIVADEKENCFYWFVYHTTKSLILKYKDNRVSFVFVDTIGGVLEFSNLLITGINVIDDYLFWTDGFNEPKKINVKLCEQGTNQGGWYHTKLIVEERGYNINSNIDFKKEHITVIKPSPKAKLTIEPVYDKIISAQAEFDFGDNTGTLMSPGDQGTISFSTFIPSNSSFAVNSIVRMLNVNSTASIIDEYEVRIKIIEDVSGTATRVGVNPINTYTFELVSISQLTSTNLSDYNCENESQQLIFPRKFIRFGYRYKYASGEYSTISSFTDPVFKPGFFEYSPKKAYNTAMENNLVSLKLRNFITADMPKDVVQVDILYSESDSPIIYLVDKIKFFDETSVTLGILASDRYLANNWDANLYEITADLIYAAIPENQLLRTYDNVPKNALAQEITGNRLVYGNYEQNYNVINKPVLIGDYISRYTNNEYYNINYGGNLTNNAIPIKEKIVLGEGQKSLKSLRDYQIGIAYLDKYGRQSPIFTNNESQFKIPKRHAAYKTKIKGQVKTVPPSWAEYFKIYVKETSTEYYNLALNRVYVASDGDLWLAFPSSERNKVDIDTFLILKKAADSNDLIREEAKYKILAIENEAPDYIKTQVKPITELDVGTDPNSTNLAQTTFNLNGPQANSRYFEIDKATYTNQNVTPLDTITEDLYVAFRDSDHNYTQRYKIKTVSTSTGATAYNITLEELFTTSDANLLYTNYPNTNNTSGVIDINAKVHMVIYSAKIENKPEFKGVFFVKINADSVAQSTILPKTSAIINYEIKNVAHLHYFSDTAAISSGTGTTQSSNNSNGSTSIGRTNSKEEWKALLDFGANSFGSTGIGNPLFPDNVSGKIIGGFFIDKAAYCGVHPAGSADNNDLTNRNHVIWTRNIDTSGNDVEFGKGVYKQNGEWYIEISYSNIGVSSDNEKPFIQNYQRKYRHTNRPEIWQPGNNIDALNTYQDNYGGRNEELKDIVSRISSNNRFRIKGVNQIFKIKSVELEKRYNHTNYENLLIAYDNYADAGGTTSDYNVYLKPTWSSFTAANNRRITYKINLGSLSDAIGNDADVQAFFDTYLLNTANASTAVAIQFIEEKLDDNAGNLITDDPAIFETEPKKTADLDIYYEASECLPISLQNNKGSLFAPIGSVVTCPARPDTINPSTPTAVVDWQDNVVTFNTPIDLVEYAPIGKDPVRVFFTRPDDSYTSLYIHVAQSNAHQTTTGNTTQYVVYTSVSTNPFALSWFNCYSFNNGVESNRIRDDFNAVILDKGVKASTVLEETYRAEKRQSGLIYSGIYNSDTGVNNLNQFIQAEKITKDLNPTYGSIQKLFSRNTDLLAFCEDRVIRIQANKDALFNADGNVNIVATSSVLGQTLPFAGDYGISTNPESFAADNYRVYFTDQQRGAVLRLSMDGLTPISDYGMSDYFKDLFAQKKSVVLGSYDDKKSEYNVTVPFNNITVSYKESIRGWSSFKSFYPEQAISVGNNYYTLKNALPYQHHIETSPSGNVVDRNTFYGEYTPSSVTVLLNDAPNVIKTYKTLSYEGSQSNINRETTSVGTGYYNLIDKEGWSAVSIETDKQKGSVTEFIEKEGKWFNYIKGENDNKNLKTNEFSFQGIGRADSFTFDPSLYPVVNGCTNPLASNYDPTATVDDGTCVYTPPTPVVTIPGCMDPSATNYDPTATYDDGSCILAANVINGCTNPNALNYDPNANVDDGSCVMPVYGCTNPGASNYDPAANVDDGSCLFSTSPGGSGPQPGGPTGPGGPGGPGNPLAPGCTDPLALNYNPLAQVDDGSCVYPGYSITVQDTNDDD